MNQERAPMPGHKRHIIRFHIIKEQPKPEKVQPTHIFFKKIEPPKLHAPGTLMWKNMSNYAIANA